MTAYLMDCGHMTQGYNVVDFRVVPVCDVCGRRGTEHVEREVRGADGLQGRESRCYECGRVRQSEWGLPFFRHFPDKPYDAHFCGCRRW